MERDEREDIFLTEARKIAEMINNRDVPLISEFRLWLKDGEYFMTRIDSQFPDAAMLYTAQGWARDYENKVDEEWVLDNIEIPEEYKSFWMGEWFRKAA